jgi:hypothetical protein
MKGKSMCKVVRCTVVAIVLGGFAGTAGLALAADRTPADILKDLGGVTPPTFEAYIKDYIAERQKVTEKRGELILELLKIAPDHEQIPKLLAERWGGLPVVGPKADDTIKEIEETLAHTKNEKVKVEGTFTKARIKLIQSRSTGAPDIAAVNEFIKVAPKDPRCGNLL